ncbi:hypothetical protein FBU59_003236 [Linderina macrospora]|uniref:Uncharacterized protein n=1 Tax=Linderina macrospora TaxID=4868 RepID=A0ACC1J917_9FUNG|nr:hypothetical protein FBU59_003236 [Linderina macrospora]
MLFKSTIILSVALAAVTSGAPAGQGVTPRDLSSGYALFSKDKSTSIMNSVQNYFSANNIKNLLPSGLYVAPNNQTGTVSEADLLKYGRYAGAAYKVLDKSWTCMINCWTSDTRGTVVDYHWNTKGDGAPSYGFVAHKSNTKEIIVSWRGSTILMDWIENMVFLPTPWPLSVVGSGVHTGFLAGYKSAVDGIKKAVADLVQKYPDYKIVLTGHSLGGAEATVAAADFALSHPEWPFPIYRVVNKGDLVPQIPTQSLGFQHHSQQIWYTPKGETKFCGSNGENSQCQNSLSLFELSILNHLQYPGLSYQLLYWAIGNIESII